MIERERMIKVFDITYKRDFQTLRKVAARGFLLWRPQAQRLYAYGEHQAAFLRVPESDVTFDILGDEEMFYRFSMMEHSNILVLTAKIPTEDEVRKSYSDCFTKEGIVTNHLILNADNIQYVPDALSWLFKWRIGDGGMAYLKQADVNYLLTSEHKAMLGRWKDGINEFGIVLLKNEDRRPRDLSLVKVRIKERCKTAYNTLFE